MRRVAPCARIGVTRPFGLRHALLAPARVTAETGDAGDVAEDADVAEIGATVALPVLGVLGALGALGNWLLDGRNAASGSVRVRL